MSQEAITSIDQLAAALAADDSQQADDQQQDVENAQPDAEAQNGDQQEQDEQDVDHEQPVENEGDQPTAESLDDKVVSWETASGEKFEVPVAELKTGYMRDQDYRHKTQNLAQEREQATRQVQEQFEQAQTYAQELGVLHVVNSQIAALEQAIPSMDKHSDPVAYFDAVTQLQQLKDHRAGVTTRVQQVQQQQQAEKQQQFQQAQQKMLTELQAAIPNFGKELIGKLDTTAQGYGFTAQELSAVTDPRFVRILHDAMQFKALQAKAPATVNKVKAAPVKPAKQAATAPTTGVEINVKQFAKKKSLDNFARLLAHTL
jgi:hypothetical protein